MPMDRIIEPQDRGYTPKGQKKKDFIEPTDKGKVTFLARDTKRRLRELEREKGYTPIKANEVAGHDGEEMPDGYIRFGDRIAVACPRELKEDRDYEKSLLHYRMEHGTDVIEVEEGITTDSGSGKKRGGRVISIAPPPKRRGRPPKEHVSDNE